LSLPGLFLLGWTATAQISIVTQHYDIARTGANTSETILTPANVNSQQFGKLFSHSVDGYVYAQPLYLPGVTMGAGTPQAGTKHNVVFIATENDSVYAFDADTNSPAANATPLWHITLLDAAHGAAPGARVMFSTDIHTTDIVPTIGITGTPVIDPSTGTLYVVGKTKENNLYVQRLHALNITNGAEKFGGPVKLAASVPGNGTASVSGTLHFDPYWENQRAGLLLLHGIVYIGFGAHEDMGPWHGWILAYNATTLRQTGAWRSDP
jgi:outer membrane protein assembly factor BamB